MSLCTKNLIHCHVDDFDLEMWDLRQLYPPSASQIFAHTSHSLVSRILSDDDAALTVVSLLFSNLRRPGRQATEITFLVLNLSS